MSTLNIANSPLIATPSPRLPLNAPGKLTMVALLAIAALYAPYIITLQAAPNWPLLTIAIVPVLCAVAIASSRPWAPILGPAMGFAVLSSPVRGDIPYNLAWPGETTTRSSFSPRSASGPRRALVQRCSISGVARMPRHNIGGLVGFR